MSGDCEAELAMYARARLGLRRDAPAREVMAALADRREDLLRSMSEVDAEDDRAALVAAAKEHAFCAAELAGARGKSAECVDVLKSVGEALGVTVNGKLAHVRDALLVAAKALRDQASPTIAQLAGETLGPITVALAFHTAKPEGPDQSSNEVYDGYARVPATMRSGEPMVITYPECRAGYSRITHISAGVDGRILGVAELSPATRVVPHVVPVVRLVISLEAPSGGGAPAPSALGGGMEELVDEAAARVVRDRNQAREESAALVQVYELVIQRVAGLLWPGPSSATWDGVVSELEAVREALKADPGETLRDAAGRVRARHDLALRDLADSEKHVDEIAEALGGTRENEAVLDLAKRIAAYERSIADELDLASIQPRLCSVEAAQCALAWRDQYAEALGVPGVKWHEVKGKIDDLVRASSEVGGPVDLGDLAKVMNMGGTHVSNSTLVRAAVARLHRFRNLELALKDLLK